MTTIIDFIDERGNVTQTTVEPTEVVLIVDEGDDQPVGYSPAVVREMEIENDGEVESVTDMCGRTESERRSDNNWDIRISGIVTSESFNTTEAGGREVSNLTLRDLKNIKDAFSVRIESALHSSDVELENLVISDSSNLVSVDVGNGEQAAFEFQLQLTEPGPS